MEGAEANVTLFGARVVAATTVAVLGQGSLNKMAKLGADSHDQSR